jgi:chromosome segregation ATPase
MQVSAAEKVVGDLQVQLERAEQELKAAQVEAAREREALEAAARSTGDQTRDQLLQSLAAAQDELAALRKSSFAEVQVLGKQLGESAGRERDLRAELEAKSKELFRLRMQLSQLQQRLEAEG